MRRNIAVLAVLWVSIAAVWVVGLRWESLVRVEDDAVRIAAEEDPGVEPIIYRIPEEPGAAAGTEAPQTAETPAETEAAAASPAGAPPREQENGTVYVVNTKSKKIHLPDCSSVADIKEANRAETEDPEPLLESGYAWCRRCHG